MEFLTRQGQCGSASLPDLVLLDLSLPRRDGWEVLELTRADSRLRCLPVLVLTSSDARDDLARCYDADANAYLTKPTDPDEFAGLVNAIERFWLRTARLPPPSQ